VCVCIRGNDVMSSLSPLLRVSPAESFSQNALHALLLLVLLLLLLLLALVLLVINYGRMHATPGSASAGANLKAGTQMKRRMRR